MKKKFLFGFLKLLFTSASIVLLSNCSAQGPLVLGNWKIIETQGVPQQRHEATLIALDKRFYSLGGRRIKPVSIFDPATNIWTQGSTAPMELHHFQAISYQDKIWIMGAMTGPYPNEKPVTHIMIYDPKADKWTVGDEIPADRRRGGAGAVLFNNKFYLVSGIQRGHMGGFVKWFDEYDPQTRQWKVLPDAPHARDHFQATIADGKLFAAGGRNTSGDTKEVFTLLVPQVDVYDFKSATWISLPESANIPTPRAGTSAITVKGQVLIVGGETARKGPAHNEVEALDPKSLQWKTLSPLAQGRHGSGVVEYNQMLWTCCGAGTQGGSKEVDSTENVEIH